ncbi:hypothetical protein ACRCUN_23615 [Mycobacterium sp. LTG2003]
MTLLGPEVPGTGGKAAPLQQPESTTAALRQVLFGVRHSRYKRIVDSVLTLREDVERERTDAENAASRTSLLRRAITALAGSSAVLASDPWLRAELCSAVAVAAPRFLHLLSGHMSLTTAGVRLLGTGAAYQRDLLDKLDTGAALGEFAHTELGDSGSPDVRTLAILDRATRRIRLVTPDLAALKVIPSGTRDDAVPRVAVVTARLVVDGHDEGVFGFLLESSTREGLVNGVDMAALPSKTGAGIDCGLIALDIEIPPEAMLASDWATFDGVGDLACALSPAQRSRRTISALSDGRVDLPNAAVATARAALAMLVHRTRRRESDGEIRMLERDLVSAAATVYATSAFGVVVAEQTTADADPGSPRDLWAMLATPLLLYNSFDVLKMCRRQSVAFGALRNSYLTDWISNCEGTITAGGANENMWVTAGGFVRRVAQGGSPSGMDITQLRIPGVPDERQWWHEMLAERVEILAVDVREGVVGHTVGPASVAYDLAAATAEHLAADCLLAAAQRLVDQTARDLVIDLAAVWTLERIAAQSLWYSQHGLMNGPQAILVDQELTRRCRALAGDLSILTSAFDLSVLSARLLADDEVDRWLRDAGWSDRFTPNGPDGRR